jgi:hypothetical protein
MYFDRKVRPILEGGPALWHSSALFLFLRMPLHCSSPSGGQSYMAQSAPPCARLMDPEKSEAKYPYIERMSR